MTTPRNARLLSLAVLAASLLAAPARADTWTGLGGTPNWLDGGNWGGVAPAPGAALTFDGALQTTNTNNFAAATAFSGITFAPTASAFTLNGNAIKLTGDITANSDAPQNISLAGIDLFGAARSINVNSTAGTLTLQSLITDSLGGASLSKTGVGTLALTNGILYSGATTVTGATLLNGTTSSQIGGLVVSGTNGTVAGPVTLVSGGNITFLPTGNITVNGAITGSGNVAVGSGTLPVGTISLAGNNTFDGSLTLSNGTFLLNSSANLGAANTLIVNSLAGQNVTFQVSGPAKTIGASFLAGGASANPQGITFRGNTDVIFNNATSSFQATAANVSITNELTGGAVLRFDGTFNMSNNAGSRTVRLSGTGTTLINGNIIETASANSLTTVNSVLFKIANTVNSNTGVVIINSPSISYHGGTQVNLGTLVYNVAGVLPPNTFQGSSTTNAYIRVDSGGAVGYAGGIMDPTFLSRMGNAVTISNTAATNGFATGSLAIISNADAATNVDFSSAPGATPTGALRGSWGSMGLGAANGAFTYSGSLTPLGQIWRLGGGNGTLTFGQAITERNAASTALAVLGGGNGVLILTGTGSNYSGSTTINSFQTLKNGVDNALSPLTSTLTVGNNAANNTATYDLNGFNQTVKALAGTGTITSSLGSPTFTVTANSASTFVGTIAGSLGFAQIGSGTMTLAGPLTYAGATSVSNAAATIVLGGTAAGALSVHAITGAGRIQVPLGIALTSDGVTCATLQIDDGASLTVRANGSISGTSKLSTLALGANGKFELTNNMLIVQETANKATALTTLQGQVTAGLPGLVGITSSSALADPVHKGIFVVDNALLGLTSFGGLDVDTNSILVAPTYKGDANFDRKVNVTDLGVLATYYGQNVAGFGILKGDFNGDNVVNVSDLGILATDYGFGTAPGSAFTLQADTAQFPVFSGTSVPEPASLSVLAVGAGALLARRRRR